MALSSGLRLSPLLFGTAAGAYGMKQASNSNWGDLWSMIPKSPWDSGSSGGASSSGGGGADAALRSELSRLSSIVQDLVRSNSSGGRPTVVHLGGRNGWTVLVFPAVAGGAVLYIYCKVTGTPFTDLFFASRNSMTTLKNTMQEGLANVWSEMRRQKDEVMNMVKTLGKKQDVLKENQDSLLQNQDALMTRQLDMDEVLSRVDCNVDNLEAKADHTLRNVDQIGQSQTEMDARLQDVHVGVQASNQGIFLMMSVLSEVTSRIGMQNSRALNTLQNCVSNGPAWIGGSSKGNGNSIEAGSRASTGSIQPDPAASTTHFPRLPALSAIPNLGPAHAHTASEPTASSAPEASSAPRLRPSVSATMRNSSMQARHSGSSSLSSSGGLKHLTQDLRGVEAAGAGQQDTAEGIVFSGSGESRRAGQRSFREGIPALSPLGGQDQPMSQAVA